MLLKFWNGKIPNHTELCDGSCDKRCQLTSYKNLPYRTLPLSEFENIDQATIATLLREQNKSAKEESALLVKHSFLSESARKKTNDTYDNIFFFKGHGYKISEIKKYIFNNYAPDTIIDHPDLPQSDTHHNQQNTVMVSRDAIRNITGYTFRPIPKWSPTATPVYIKWQEDLLEDNSEYVVVDGSRQMGKSMTIAEKLVEESFIPDNDSLVGAFTSKSTGAIRRYFLRLTRKFPEGTFEEYKKDEYIENKKTLTKIFFRTLADDAADSSRGLTLKNAYVDEAQLVSDFVFEEIIEPMLSTTGGKLVLIGTASRKRAGYMYDLAMQIRKKSIQGSYYRVSVEENPLIHPRKREQIMANRDKPSVRREYFNEWGDLGDELFLLPKTSEPPKMSIADDFFVLAVDPARLKDRSGFALIHVSDKARIIQSGFVPEAHKREWSLQARWYLTDILAPYFSKHPKYKRNSNEFPSEKFYVIGDVTGVGDGALEIFRQTGLKIHARLRYVSGFHESDDGYDYRVGKTVLINTFLDMCQEGTVEAFTPTNTELFEEISHIEEELSRGGQVMMKTSFYDDITNATMIGCYFIKKRRLLGRSKAIDGTVSVQSPFRAFDHMEAIERSREIRRTSSRVW